MIDRDKLQAVFLALLMIGSVVAMSAGTVAAAQPSSAADAAQSTLDNVESTSESIDSETTADDTAPSVSAPTRDVEISDGLANKKGEAVVLLSVERGLDREALAGVDAETLKADSENTLRPVAQQVNSLEHAQVRNQYWVGNVLSVRVDLSEHDAKDLAAIEGVTAVTPNVDVHLPSPVDPEETEKSASAESSHGYTYGLQQIGIPSFEEKYGDRGGNATVTVIDDGVSTPDDIHPDLDFAIEAIASNGNVTTGTLGSAGGHGEHVAGTVSGAANPAGDVPRYGVAPNASVIMINAFEGGATLTDILASVEYSVEQDSDVTTMSLGFGSTTGYSTVSNVVENTMQDAVAAGTLVTVSAGNSGSGASGGPTTSPGAEFTSMSIGASNSQGSIAAFSSGDVINPNQIELIDGDYPEHYPREYVNPDVSAPGVQVLSTGPLGTIEQENPTYSYSSGTSMAAPHVAGAATLLQSMTEEDLDPKLIEMALAETAEKPDNDYPSKFGRDIRYGTGIINVTAAADALMNGSMAVDGTVTDTGGDPIQGASVSAESGALTSTNASGDYTLHTTQDEVTITADAFGYEASTQTVSSGPADFTLEDAMEIDLVEGQDVYAEFGSQVNATVDVRNLENLTVSLTQETNVSQDDVTLLVNGQEATLGEPVALDRYNGTAEVTVELADDANYSEGQVIGLEHTFEGLGDSITVETGPTTLTEELEPAFFELSNLNTVDELVTGQDLPITVDVTNTGQVTATKDVQLILNGGDASLPPSSYELEPGETTTIQVAAGGVGSLYEPGQTFTAGFRSADSIEQGLFGYSVTGLNDQVNSTIALQAQGPQFQVASFDAPTEADPGSEVEVTATIENIGSQSDTQNVTFSFDGQAVANESVSLEAYQLNSSTNTAEVTFTATVPEESGVYTHSVSTANDSASRPIGVDATVTSVTVVSDNEFGAQTVSLLERGIDLQGTPAVVSYESAADVDASVVDDTDVFVFHNMGEDTAESVIPMVESSPLTSAVYLEQWASDSDAITQRSAVTGDPASVSRTDGGTVPVSFEITQDSPLFDGVGEAGDTVPIHVGSFADRAYFEGASGETLATVTGSSSSAGGPAAAVDPESGSVLLASIAPESFVAGSAYTDDAARILANSVEVASDEGIVADAVGETSIDADFVGTVDDAEAVTVTAEDVVADGELVDGEMITFTIGGEPVATAEVENGTATATFDPATLDAEAGQTLSVSVEEMVVANEDEVETVHETLDLDEGYNLLSVPQAADLSADNVTAVNTWNTSGATYESVTQSEFDSASDLHQGLYVSAAADDARLGMTFSQDVPVGGTADLDNGWTLTGSNFAIDSTEMQDTRTLNEDLLEVDPSELSVFSATFNQKYDGQSTISAYEAYWAFNDENTSYERAVISPSYEVEDREDVLGLEDSDFEITNVDTSVQPRDELLLDDHDDDVLSSTEDYVVAEVTVTNNGGLDTQFVDLHVDDAQNGSYTMVDRSLGLTLEEGQTETVTLMYAPTQDDPPAIDLQATTEDSDSSEVTVDLGVGGLDVEDQALTLDDEFVVSGVDFAGEANVEVVSNGSVVGSTTVADGTASDLVIPVNASMIENSEVEVRLLNADGEQQTNETVTIEETTIEVTNDAPAYALSDQDSVPVPVDVTNNALIEQTIEVEFSVAGSSVANTTVDVGPGYNNDVAEFSADVSGLSVGDSVEHTVSAAGSSDTKTLTIAESTITFNNQSLNDEGQVLVEDVTLGEDQIIAVTDTDFNIVGTADPGAVNGDDVLVDINLSATSVGPHIAHIVTDTSDVSDGPGLVNDQATIVDADVSVDDVSASFDEDETAEVSEVTVQTADVAAATQTNFTVEIRQNGDVIGESDVLTGSNSDVTVTLDEPVTSDTTVEAVLVNNATDEAFQSSEQDYGEYGTPTMVADSAEINITVGELDASVNLPHQEIGSNNGSDAVLVDGVTGDEGQYVVITDSDLNVVGTYALDDRAANEEFVVQLDDSVEPGEYRAHLTSDVSLVGDDGVVTDAGELYEADVAFEDQEFVGSSDEVTVQTADLMDGMGNDTDFVIAIHENNASGDVLGYSDVLTGSNDDVVVDGLSESIDEEGEYVAMLHFTADATDTIPLVDNGSVSTITDNATITPIESAAAFSDQILTTSAESAPSATNAGLSFSSQSVSAEGTVNVTDVTTNGQAAIFVIDGSGTIAGLRAVGDVSDESYEVEIQNVSSDGNSTPLEALIVGADDVSNGTAYAAGDQISTPTQNALLDNTGTQSVTEMENASADAGTLSGLTTSVGSVDRVLVEDVQANQTSTIVVTYPNDGNLTIVGMQGGVDNTMPENYTVDIEDASGFPGQHTAHIIPTDDLSGNYGIGDNVSAATAANVTTQVTADVYDAELSLADQTVQDVTEGVTIETANLYDGMGNTTEFMVELTADGEVIGTSETLTGNNSDVNVGLMQSISATTDVTATIVDTSGDEIPQVVGSEFAPFEDRGTVTVETAVNGNVNFSAQAVGDDGEVVVENVEPVDVNEVTTEAGVEPQSDFLVLLDADGNIVDYKQFSAISGFSSGDDVTLNASTSSAGEHTVAIHEANESGTAPDVDAPRGVSASATVYVGDVSVSDQTLQQGTDALNTITVSTADLLDGSNDGAQFTLNVTSGGESLGTATATGANSDVDVTLDEELDRGTTDVTVTAEVDGEAVAVASGTSFVDLEDSATITVESSQYLVEEPRLSADTIVEGTESIDADVVVENAGEVDGEQDITLRILDSEGNPTGVSETLTNVQVFSGESRDLPFNGIDVSGLSAGEYTVEVSSADTTNSTNLTVQSTNYEVSSLDIAGQGDDAALNVDTDNDVSVTVNNTGDVANPQNVTLTVSNASGDQISVEQEVNNAPADPEQTVTFTNAVVGNLTPGEYTVEVASLDDDPVTGTLIVNELGFEINAVDVGGEGNNADFVVGSGPVSTNVTIENVGGQTETQDVELMILDDGSEVYNDTFGLQVVDGETRDYTFSGVPTQDLNAGNYTVRITTEDDRYDASLEIYEPAEGVLDISAEPGVSGTQNNFTFTFDASSIDDDTDIQELRIDFDGAVTDSAIDAIGDNATVDNASVAGTQLSSQGTLLITPSDSFTLSSKNTFDVEVFNVSVANNGTFDGELDFRDDSSVVVSSGNDSYSIASDSGPSVQVTTPSDGANVTSQSSFDGTASDDVGVTSVELAVENSTGATYNDSADAFTSEDTTVAVSGTESWSATLGNAINSEGTYTVTATATDTAGNTATDTVSFTVDTTAPTIEDPAPSEGVTQANADTVYTVNVTDALTGVESISVTVTDADGTVLDGVSTDDAAVSYDGTELTIDGPTYASGEVTVDVSADDYAGNSAQFTSNFSVDTAGPEFNNPSPADGATVADSGQTYTVEITDALDEVNASSISVTVEDANGNVLNNAGTGTTGVDFSSNTLTIDQQNYADGQVNVTVTAEDGFGNSATFSSSFTVDTAGPTVNNPNPADGASDVSNTTAYTVDISDDLSGVDENSITVTVDDGGTTVLNSVGTDDGNVSYSGGTLTIDGQTYTNGNTVTVTVNVDDNAGNSATEFSSSFTVET